MKYKSSDFVEFKNKKCKILTAWKNKYGKVRYRVEVIDFTAPDNGRLYEADEKELKEWKDKDNWDWVSSKFNKWNVNPDVRCPICDTEWTVTKFNSKKWYDCLKCKKTKEQIMSGK